MKIDTILLALLLAICAGCDNGNQYVAPVHTFFPTNHWVVKSVVEGEVVVEAIGTNLTERFRVVRAIPVSPLTNGQPVRVELSVRQGKVYQIELVSARAYPATD